MVKVGWESMRKGHQTPDTRHQKNLSGPGPRIAGGLAPLGFLFFLFLCDSLLACPMCGDILERGKDALASFRFAKGITWSILFMLTMPYLLVGGTIFFIVRAAKKAKSKQL